jgi:hypothetical protein
MADTLGSDDPRLSDARTPLAHAHVQSDVTGLASAFAGKQATSEKGQANGYASLEADGKVPSAQLPASQGGGATITRIAGASGAAGGADFVFVKLTSNTADVTTTALSAAVLTVTGVTAGTYLATYYLFYQAALTTTGIAFGLNHTGAGSTVAAMWHHVTTGGAAATGVGDDTASVNAGQLVEGKSGLVMNAIIGSASAGVAVANTHVFAILEAGVTVTNTGDLQLKIASEVAGSAVRLMAGSALKLYKVA